MSVSRSPREPIPGLSGLALTWIGCGLTTIALAFTVSPVHASLAIFWAVIGVGIVMLGIGARLLIRRGSPPSTQPESVDTGQQLAAECRRLHYQLTHFVIERDRARPWPMLGASRIEAWHEDTLTRYRDELRDWALQVFDAAVACGAVATTARGLVQSPAVAQLKAVRDLFQDAARTLERR